MVKEMLCNSVLPLSENFFPIIFCPVLHGTASPIFPVGTTGKLEVIFEGTLRGVFNRTQ